MQRRPPDPPPDPPPESSRRRVAIITAAFLAVIVALGAVATLPASDGDDGAQKEQTPRRSTANQPSQQRTAAPDRSRSSRDGQHQSGGPLSHLARREPGDPMALGRVDAPVVIVEYAEFQCPYCRQFAEQTQPKIVRDYVKTGKVRLEWRDFPYLGQESKTAARAGRAAARQGKFWEYHDALFAQEHELNSGTFTKEFLVDQAGKLGLDTDRFARDMDSPKVKQAVRADLAEGSTLGVTGTPAFVIGTTPMLGARPYSDFADAIDAELRAAR